MKKLFFYLLLFSMFAGCRQTVLQPDDLANLEAFLNGNFKAILVREDEILVYQEGSSTNIIPGYSRYKLAFSGTLANNPTVKLTEYTGEEFTGKWNLTPINGDSFKLTLSELNPQPTGTNGIMEFLILAVNENDFDMKGLKSSPKTGDSLNQYKMKKI